MEITLTAAQAMTIGSLLSDPANHLDGMAEVRIVRNLPARDVSIFMYLERPTPRRFHVAINSDGYVVTK